MEGKYIKDIKEKILEKLEGSYIDIAEGKSTRFTTFVRTTKIVCNGKVYDDTRLFLNQEYFLAKGMTEQKLKEENPELYKEYLSVTRKGEFVTVERLNKFVEDVLIVELPLFVNLRKEEALKKLEEAGIDEAERERCLVGTGATMVFDRFDHLKLYRMLLGSDVVDLDDINDADYIKEQVASEGRKLVMVTAEWCGPCIMSRPLVEKFCRENSIKLISLKDTLRNDKRNVLTEIFPDFQGFPSYYIMSGAEVEKSHIGFETVEDLNDFLLNLIK